MQSRPVVSSALCTWILYYIPYFFAATRPKAKLARRASSAYPLASNFVSSLCKFAKGTLKVSMISPYSSSLFGFLFRSSSISTSQNTTFIFVFVNPGSTFSCGRRIIGKPLYIRKEVCVAFPIYPVSSFSSRSAVVSGDSPSSMRPVLRASHWKGPYLPAAQYTVSHKVDGIVSRAQFLVHPPPSKSR